MENIIAIWKPAGPTSHDIINQLRRQTGIKKIGHAGTLDPLAEGILVVGIGRAGTKQLTELVSKKKEYQAIICLGAESETDDAQGPITPRPSVIIPNLNQIETAIKKFIGRIKQQPPIYSALKIKGRPAYKIARGGEKPVLKTRSVNIFKIDILSYDYPNLTLKIETGSGVYIRALARDLGEVLETGAYLARLTRTRVGSFDKTNCVRIDELPDNYKKEYASKTN
ncbi:MAG: tRNA pseudouridine(55) synthase TruB [Patescibacteria group bacterium]